MEVDFSKFDLTPEQKMDAKKHVLMDIYLSCYKKL